MNAPRQKPIQTGKFCGILLVLVLAFAGFFRIVDASLLVDDPRLADGQFLTLLLVPLVSAGLMVVIVTETVITGYNVIRTDASVTDQLMGRPGYVALRGAEAGTAVAGVLVMVAIVPRLFSEGTPAPAGVGLLLLLLAIGVGILALSLLRSFAELVVYR
ncbi:hypothetical protein C463_14625 [Halorubrum californiense DSM 19288]|uniref:Uncharacterized protein n=1 Tax=Halorubrum californiense DSM 19288 TaxID=1227465 RepID=M0DYW5_9EURY|nr:hypothetical protein [Halorubrum californiense]ELZ40686.1 hypothetical protein C463_14625 [Halorubrum californiense DSM 19288]